MNNFDLDTIIHKICQDKIFKLISSLSGELNIPVYVVGGYIRDKLLDRPSKDVDILVIGDGIDFAHKLKIKTGGKSILSIFKTFGTANLKSEDYEIEFVGARKESYPENSRKPVVKSGSLTDDISRRDFTINAMAVNLSPDNYGEFIDYFHGLDDLQNKIIRTPLEPDKTFSDDPLRMMRAIRFASQLGFTLHNDTMDSIRQTYGRLGIISQERVTDELNKIILSPEPSYGLKLLHQSGLLSLIFPELEELKGIVTVDNKSHKDNFFHTLEVLDNIAHVSDNLWLRWAALLHDLGKISTKQFDPANGWTFHAHDVVGANMVPGIFRRFKLPLNEKMKYVRKLVYLHLRPVSLTNEVTDSALRRLIVDSGDELNDLLTLCKADVTSKNKEKVKSFIAKFDLVSEKIKLVEEKDKLRNWKNPITGEIIMKTFGINPSRQIGLIKDAVKEAILEGLIQNDYSEAYELMLKLGKELGLKLVE